VVRFNIYSNFEPIDFNMKKQHLIIFLSILLALFTSCSHKKVAQIKASKKENIVKEFGFVFNNYNVLRDTIRKGENFGEIMARNHVPYPTIYKITKTIKKLFDVRRLRAGKSYVILKSKDSIKQPEIFIYQPDNIDYTVVNFRDSIYTYRSRKKVKIVIKTATGVITSSLSQAIEKEGLSYNVVNDLSEIYAWTIDFFRLQKNDKFKIIYEEKYINDSVYAGMGKIKAAYFEHDNLPFYAFDFIADSIHEIPEYFDARANNLRRAFLRAPLKFSRISSRYNKRRYIKFYGRIKPHLGTDFAAPIGTPIMATANGVISKRAYTSGNGNYIKIHHNSEYDTQYLHMSRFKKGLHVGSYVKQGDIIGYVGETGHASGPHVCYRFWKFGKQVDCLKEKLPSAKPMKKNIREKYFSYILPYKKELDSLNYKEIVETNLASN